MRRLPSLVLLACLAAGPLCADDSAVVLARILAEKGIISKDDLARVERAPNTVQAVTQVAAKALTAPAPAPQAEKPAAVAPVTVYGTILWNAYLNTSLTNNADIPFFTGKQGSDATGNDKNFGMTARQTRLGVRYQGPQVAGAKLSAVLETDFFGGQDALPVAVGMSLIRMRLGYGRLDWKAFSLEGGQDWSVFAPLNPASLASFAIPAMAGSGNPWIRLPQIRAEWRANLAGGRALEWQIAATDPNVGDYPVGFATSRAPLVGERGRLPGFDTRLNLSWKMNGKQAGVAASSHYARGKNAGVVGPRTVQQGVDSWGAALDYVLPLHKRFTITGEAFTGRALGIYSVSFGQGVLPAGTAGAHGVGSSGGWTQGQVQLASRWQWNMGYGLESNEAANLRTGDRNRNQTVMSNVMYRLSPQFTLAGEWRRFLTDFYNQQTASERGDHFNVAIGYIF